MNTLFLFYMLIVTYINNIFMLPFLLISKLFTKKIISLYTNSIYLGGSCIFKYYYNMSTYIKNTKILHELLNLNEPTIIISNHLTQFDAIFLGLLLANKKQVQGQEKVPDLLCKSAKLHNDLCYIPTNNIRVVAYYLTHLVKVGYSILLYLNKSIMISNNKNKNFLNLENCKIDKGDILYLYPEGNVYCSKMKNIVDKYCDDNNIERMKNCLYPRSGALDILEKNNNIKTIYSICVQYDTIKPCGKYHTLLNTKLPNKVYFNLNKHELNSNIYSKTVDIFRNFDKELDQDINESEYLLIGKYYNELYCQLSHILLFIFACYYLYNYNYVLMYYITMTILYYIYTFISIYTNFN